MTPEITVGILTYNSTQTLADTFSSLRAQTLDRHLWQILIVDHGSSDGTRQMCEDFVRTAGNAQLVMAQENHIAKSRQFILQKSTSNWVVFLDSDVILPETWLESALDLARTKMNDGRFSGVGAPLQIRPLSLRLRALALMQKNFMGHFATEQMQLEGGLRRVGHLPTAASMFRREDLLAAGGFHSRWRFCGEDLELGTRLTTQGRELWMSPKLQVIHQLSCQTWWDWACRAARFGRTRIQVARVHPHLWFEPRTWLPLIFASLQSGLILSSVWTGRALGIELWCGFTMIYFCLLGLCFRQLRVAALAFLTHSAFAWAELYELLTGPFEVLTESPSVSYPHNMQPPIQSLPIQDSLPSASFILPCLNESLSLGEVLSCIQQVSVNFENLEILVVDNGSYDNSPMIAVEHGARVLRCSKRGYGAALHMGIANASHDLLVFADADGTYDWTEAPRLIQTLIALNADLVVGNRLSGKIEAQAMPLLNQRFGTPLLSFFDHVLLRPQAWRSSG